MKKEEGFPGQISFVIPDRIITSVQKNALIADLYITDIGYYPKARYHFRKRPTGSNQYILIYCIEGMGEIRLNENVYLIPTDHFFIIPAGMPHSYRSDELNPWSIYWIHFSGKKSAGFNRYSCQSLAIERGITSRVSERLELFSEIFSNLDRGFSTETLDYVNLCLPFLLGSFIYVSQFKLGKESKDKDPVDQSINLMIENLTKKLKVSEISAEVGYSASHFCRLFLSKTGHSPIDYFIQLKIQRACRLLENSGWSIADVAREMGFEDQFYFSRVFLKVMGMSPAAYRKIRI